MMQKSYVHKPADVKRQWHLFDANDQVLGRLASQVAQKLIGKQYKEYTPHVDVGDYVVVINAASVAVTGKKETEKKYYTHSGYPGGLKVKTLARLRQSNPQRVIEKAVYNMLPKNKLRSSRMNRLKVYAGSEHKHQSQFRGKD